jgi:alpha-amylase
LWDHGYKGNELIKTLNKLRQVAISKDQTFVTTLATYLYHDDYQLFYQKGSIFVGLSGQGANRNIAPYEMIIQGTKYTPGQALIEILSCSGIIAGSGKVMVIMKNGEPVVVCPREWLLGSGICGL